MAPGWSRDETAALLRAWKEVAENPTGSTTRAIFRRFQAFCGGTTRRSMASLHLRKDQLTNLHDVVTAFNAGSGGDKADACGRRSWYLMNECDKKTWFAKMNTKSYPFVELEEEHYYALVGIMKRQGGSHSGRWTRRHSCADKGASSFKWTPHHGSLAGEEKPSLMQRVKSTSAALDDQSTQDGGVSEYSGSSTESDDDMLESWDEIVPQSPVRDSKFTTSAPLESSIDLKESGDSWRSSLDQKPKTLARSLAHSSVYPPEQKDQKKRKVDPELLGLVDIIERQAHLLRDMFHQAKEARKQDQQERDSVLAQIKQDREERKEILERVKRNEEAIRREREEWKLERDEMKREWARVLEERRRG